MIPFAVDTHCDLLSYMLYKPSADPLGEEIGCALPFLKKGNVKLQIMAIYTATEKGSSEQGLKQGLIFKKLLTDYNDRVSLIKDLNSLSNIGTSQKIGVLAAVENASGFCGEEDTLKEGFDKLDKIINTTERILYIGLTHHGENRFGGGNASTAGLKEDGKALLNYLHGKRIAVDFSHTSDALAFDLLNYISKFNLDIPVLASHSNFRKVFNHPRNLPDEIAKELIKRKGLIGINFLRAFLNTEDPNAFYDHIDYGIYLGGSNAMCFGADYFYTAKHPDQSRKPFFFKEHENASCYPSLLEHLSARLSPEQLENMGNKNVRDFIKRIWT